MLLCILLLILGPTCSLVTRQAEKKGTQCSTIFRMVYYNIHQLEYYDTQCEQENIQTCSVEYHTMHRVTYTQECHTEYKTVCVVKYRTELQNKCFTVPQKKCREQRFCRESYQPGRSHTAEVLYCPPAEACREYPTTSCHAVQVQVPVQECREVQQDKCEEIPRTEEYQVGGVRSPMI